MEDDVEIGANTTIDRGALEETRISRGVKLDNSDAGAAKQGTLIEEAEEVDDENEAVRNATVAFCACGGSLSERAKVPPPARRVCGVAVAATVPLDP